MSGSVFLLDANTLFIFMLYFPLPAPYNLSRCPSRATVARAHPHCFGPKGGPMFRFLCRPRPTSSRQQPAHPIRIILVCYTMLPDATNLHLSDSSSVCIRALSVASILHPCRSASGEPCRAMIRGQDLLASPSLGRSAALSTKSVSGTGHLPTTRHD